MFGDEAPIGKAPAAHGYSSLRAISQYMPPVAEVSLRAGEPAHRVDRLAAKVHEVPEAINMLIFLVTGSISGIYTAAQQCKLIVAPWLMDRVHQACRPPLGLNAASAGCRSWERPRVP